MGRGIDQTSIFRDDNDRDDFLSRLAILAGREQVTVYAFALMPNHFHLLMRPLLMPLPRFMSRLLTGYSMRFNRRHGRRGHLFQNRYKSIVVEEERYLLQLIRYIHLNPLRAGIVNSLAELAPYPYTGHSALLGLYPCPWLQSDETLSNFAPTAKPARRILLKFMNDGLASGARPDPSENDKKFLDGNGDDRSVQDNRVLGSREFAIGLLGHHRRMPGACPSPEARENHLERLLERVARQYDLSLPELCSGSKRAVVIKARHAAIWLGLKSLGLPATDLAHALRIKPTAVYRAITRDSGNQDENVAIIDLDMA